MEYGSTKFDYVILGGGSAGCVMANRLSASGKNHVLLVEAGEDYPPGNEPRDMLDSYPMGASFNPAYHWRGLQVRLGHVPSNAVDSVVPRFMEQARVIGGGSSINAQMANRGAPMDYDEWSKLGARGWNWENVLPYFRKLESDQDIQDEFHGNEGPVSIRRVPESNWPGFAKTVAAVLTDTGLKALTDQNGLFEDGWFACTISNKDETRVSAAMGYLDFDARNRENLHILSETTAEKLLFSGNTVTGAMVKGKSGQLTLSGERFIVSAGALHTPVLLMRSGIGRADHLKNFGIPVVADRPGVGENLNEHPTIAVSAYLASDARLSDETGTRRHAQIGFRYSSGLDQCAPGDMYVSVTAKSAWHAVGVRLGSFLMWCNKPYSRGRVQLAGKDPSAEPDVDFSLLKDRRDYERLADGVRRMAGYFSHPLLNGISRDAFPSCYSERVRKIGAVNTKNRILTSILAAIMDGPGPLRRAAIKGFITKGCTLSQLLADEKAMEDYIRDGVTGCWHPSGTAKMGASDDVMAVTSPFGEVYGVNGLTVCDASIFPCVPRANTNIPTIMCAEKVADGLLSNDKHL
ncbi:MAG: GMC family oxidoreductase N-terminal domain-containing protein [Pseudomonadota bacterium]|nr:GMC family oxidoreductase N-terminal domain-containing protein [Pseudomonadota bacterium]